MSSATILLGSILTCVFALGEWVSAQPAPGRSLPSSPTDVSAPRIVEGPTIRQNPNESVPLAAVIELRTDEPTRVRLGVHDGRFTWSAPGGGDFTRVHEVPVLGMRPGRRHQILVTVRDRTGNQTRADRVLEYQTPLLPPDFPPLEVTTSLPALMEPGPIAFTTSFSSPAGSSGAWRIVLSQEGEVIWYLRDSSRGSDIHRLRNGNVLMTMGGRELIVEIDLLGNVLHSWVTNLYQGKPQPGAVLVDTDTIHHEMFDLPAGHDADFLALGSEARIYPNYPANEIDVSDTVPAARVIGDVILELDRDGTIVRETKLLDILDPYRICYDSLNGGYWDRFYGDDEYSHVHDWAHANAVTVDPRDGNYIVSLRHQDAVVKIVPESTDPGGVVWILGDPGRWRWPWSSKVLKPIGPAPFSWPFHQHAPELDAAGRLVLFDNGNHQTVPPRRRLHPGDWYSRAVAYGIDEARLSIQQAWAYGGRADIPSNRFYSGFLGDADPLPSTGNVLVTDGGKTTAGGVNYARIVEVTRTSPAVPVFEVVIREPDESKHWRVYRAEKLAW